MQRGRAGSEGGRCGLARVRAASGRAACPRVSPRAGSPRRRRGARPRYRRPPPGGAAAPVQGKALRETIGAPPPARAQPPRRPQRKAPEKLCPGTGNPRPTGRPRARPRHRRPIPASPAPGQGRQDVMRKGGAGGPDAARRGSPRSASPAQIAAAGGTEDRGGRRALSRMPPRQAPCGTAAAHPASREPPGTRMHAGNPRKPGSRRHPRPGRPPAARGCRGRRRPSARPNVRPQGLGGHRGRRPAQAASASLRPHKPAEAGLGAGGRRSPMCSHVPVHTQALVNPRRALSDKGRPGRGCCQTRARTCAQLARAPPFNGRPCAAVHGDRPARVRCRRYPA